MSDLDPAIPEFLKEKTVLIITDNATDRTTWKKMFHEFGCNISNFMGANSVDEATEMIQENDFNIIFSTYNFEDQTTIELLDLHIQKHPDRSNYLFFMASDKNSLAVAACAAEHDIDTMLIKPYNLNDLHGAVKDAVLSKAKMNKEQKFYYSIQENLTKGEYDLAQEKIAKFLENRPDSPNPIFLNGRLFHIQGDLEKALEIWQTGLEKDPFHHKLLHSIFDTFIDLKKFSDAYPFAQTLCEKYPINPERIPNLIRVSLSTKNYQDLIDFCKMILEVESNLTSIRRPIAAALAICAKNMAEDEEHYELVKSSSLKAIELTEHTSQIFYTSLSNLITCGDYRSAQKIIDEITTDDMTQELYFLELKISSLDESKVSETFVKAQNLLKLNYKSPELYEIMLKASVGVNKNKNFIEDIVFDACKEFPNFEETFKAFNS